MSTPRLVEVRWEDARQPVPSWCYVRDVEPVMAVQCITVGWLVSVSPTAIRVAQSMGDINDTDDCAQCNGIAMIPRSSVRGIRALRTGKRVRLF